MLILLFWAIIGIVLVLGSLWLCGQPVTVGDLPSVILMGSVIGVCAVFPFGFALFKYIEYKLSFVSVRKILDTQIIKSRNKL